MVNIDCDQKMRPRDRSQSHKPQRPRLSAVSMRPRTASLMRSPSRARVDCQWNAKPRISTTKPVVAESVTDSAASDRHSESSVLLDDDDLTRQRLDDARIASAPLPFGQGDVADAACWPGRRERQRRGDDVEHPVGVAEAGLDGNAGQHALVGAGDDDVAARRVPQVGIRLGSSSLQALDSCGAFLPDRGHAVEALGEQIGNRGEVALHRRRAFAGSDRPPARRRRGRW